MGEGYCQACVYLQQASLVVPPLKLLLISCYCHHAFFHGKESILMKHANRASLTQTRIISQQACAHGQRLRTQ